MGKMKISYMAVVLFLATIFCVSCGFTVRHSGISLKKCHDLKLDTAYFNNYTDAVKCSKMIAKRSNDPELTQRALFILGEREFLRGNDSEAFNYLIESAKGPECITAFASIAYIRELNLTYSELDRIASIDTSSISSSYCRNVVDMEKRQWNLIKGNFRRARNIGRNINILRNLTLLRCDRHHLHPRIDSNSELEHILLDGGSYEKFEHIEISLPETSDNINPADFFTDTGNSVFYYVYKFSLLKETTLPIVVSSDSPYRMYLNGHLIFHRENVGGLSSEHFDNSENLRLTRGDYEIVVKSVVSGSQGSSFKIMMPEYRSRQQLFTSNPVGYAGTFAYHDTEKEKKVVTLFDRYLMFHAGKLIGKDFSKEEILDLYSHTLGSKTPPLLYKIAQNAYYRYNNRVRAENLLKKILDVSPEKTRPLFSLMKIMLDSNRLAELDELKNYLPQDIKEHFHYRLFIADYYSFRGLYPLSLNVSKKNFYDFRDYPVTALYFASALEEFGALRKALEKRIDTLKRIPYYFPILERSWFLSNKTGDFSNEVSVLKKMLEITPYNREVNHRLGAAYLKNFRLRDAKRIFKGILSRSPDDVRAILALGDIASLNDDIGSVAKYYGKAYKIAPENREVAEKASFLFDTDFRKFFSDHSFSDEDVRKIVMETPSLRSDAPFEIIFDEGLQRIINQRMIKGRFRLAIRLHNMEGIRLFSTVEKEGAVLQARVIKQDGTIVENVKEDARSLIFYSLEPGDTIDYTYLISQENHSWLDGFNSVWHFGQFGIFNRFSRISVFVPDNMAVHFFVNGDVTERVAETDENGKLHIFETRDVYLHPKENMMPRDLLSVIPNMQMSGVTSWDDFAKWQSRFIEEGSVLTTEMEHLVETVVRNTDDRTGIIASLRDFVARDIAYSFGKSGIYLVKPERSDVTFKRKSGDCKDKALLLKVLLEAAGINSKYTLVRSLISGEFRIELPYMQFDHALVYIPSQEGIEKGFFVDPTASYDYFLAINPEIENTTAMVIDEVLEKYKFKKIISGIQNRLDFSVGSGPEKRSELLLTGGAASNLRFGLYSGESIKKLLSDLLFKVTVSPLSNLGGVALAGSPLDEPLKIYFYSDPFFPAVVSTFFKELLAVSERKHPIQLPSKTMKYTFTIYMDEVPQKENLVVENDFFKYTATFTDENRVKVDFLLKKRRIEPEEFAELKKNIIRIVEFEKRIQAGIEW